MQHSNKFSPRTFTCLVATLPPFVLQHFAGLVPFSIFNGLQQERETKANFGIVTERLIDTLTLTVSINDSLAGLR